MTAQETLQLQLEMSPLESIAQASRPFAFSDTDLRAIYESIRGRLPLDRALDAIEKGLLVHALTETRGNQTKAAELLRITFRQVRYSISKYKIDPRAYADGNGQASYHIPPDFS